jgi:hypothetical protein
LTEFPAPKRRREHLLQVEQYLRIGRVDDLAFPSGPSVVRSRLIFDGPVANLNLSCVHLYMPHNASHAHPATETDEDREDHYFVTSLCGAAFLTAIIYLAVAVPLCWRFAERAGKSVWKILLFIDVPAPPKALFGLPNFLSIGFRTDAELSFWMAVAVAFGIMNVIVPLLVLAGRRSLSIVIAANGFVWGYLLTWSVVRMVGLGDIQPFRVAFFQMIYIYLIFLVCEFAKHKLPEKSRNTHWLGMMVDGMFALAVSFLLSVGQQASVELVAGPLFLITSVISMLVIENTLIRLLISALLSLQAVERRMKGRSGKGSKGLGSILRLVYGATRRNMSRGMEELLLRFQDLWPRHKELSFSETWEIRPRLLVGCFLLNATFPVAVTVLWTKVVPW